MEPPCASFHSKNALEAGLQLIHSDFCKWLSSLSELSPIQKGFVVRLLILGGLLLAAGWVLKLIAYGLSASVRDMADMNVFSWVKIVGGLVLMTATPVISMHTLRYGKRHEVEIRERAGLAAALTIYRVLFWLLAATLLLLGMGIFWLVANFGPVH